MLAVAPVGPAPDDVLEAVMEALERAFGVPAGRAPAADEPEGAYSPTRAQWSSADFLRRLAGSVPPGATRLLGVTERDLFVPVLSFVYGQAQLRGAVAVVSLARLRPEFHGLPPGGAALLRRAATEAVHEVGHTFGLVHCLDCACPMSLSMDLPDLDAKTPVPCPGCAALLREAPELRRLRAVGDRREGGRR